MQQAIFGFYSEVGMVVPKNMETSAEDMQKDTSNKTHNPGLEKNPNCAWSCEEMSRKV